MALETLEAIAKHFANGWFDKYPPVHYAVLEDRKLSHRAAFLRGISRLYFGQ
jgi:hypothetical protein